MDVVHDTLRRFDLTRSGGLDLETFAQAMRRLGLGLGSERLRTLFEHFDVRRSHKVGASPAACLSPCLPGSACLALPACLRAELCMGSNSVGMAHPWCC